MKEQHVEIDQMQEGITYHDEMKALKCCHIKYSMGTASRRHRRTWLQTLFIISWMEDILESSSGDSGRKIQCHLYAWWKNSHISIPSTAAGNIGDSWSYRIVFYGWEFLIMWHFFMSVSNNTYYEHWQMANCNSFLFYGISTVSILNKCRNNMGTIFLIYPHF